MFSRRSSKYRRSYLPRRCASVLWTMFSFSLFTVICIAFLVSLIVSADEFTRTSHMSKSCSKRLAQRNLPRVWIQFGNPRTATTLQYEILVAFAYTICGRRYVKRSFTAQGYNVAQLAEKNHVVIVKAHNISAVQYLPFHFTEPFAIFTTRKGGAGRNDALLTKVKNGTLLYSQEFRLVEQYPVKFALHDYQAIFKISDPARLRMVSKWIELWDIKRLCCGRQMSTAWRKVLWAMNETTEISTDTGTTGIAGVGTDSGSVTSAKALHLCNIYDFIKVESSMAYIENKFFGYGKMPKTKIGDCDCSIRATQRDKLTFNDERYQTVHNCGLNSEF